MPDKDATPIDPSWADEGWQQMQQMLEQEMPAPARSGHRKRRALPVALLGLLLIAAALWLTLFSPASSPSADALSALPIPVMSSPAEAGLETAGRRDKEHQPTAPSAPLASTAQMPEERIPSATGRRYPPMPPIDNSRPLLRQAYGAADMAAAESFPAKQPAPARLSLKQLPTEPTPLPIASSSSLPAQPSASAPPKIRYGLRAGIALADFQAPDGYTAEFITAFRLGNQSPLYARASLGYWYWQQWETEGERTFLFTNSSYFQPNQNNSGTQTLSAVNGTEEMHYATLSSELGYQFHPRWSLETGLQYARQIYRRSAVRWSTQSEQVTNSNPADETEPEALSTVAEQLRHNNQASRSRASLLSARAGLRYRISSRLSASLHWQQSLQGVFQPPASPQYRSFALCSVTYWVQ
jgi:hypothetical protein